MNLSEEQRAEFDDAVKPLIMFLNDNFHPHTYIIIDPTHGILLETERSFYTEEYIKD